MLISHKCQYALRAVFELALRQGQGSVKIADIAQAQAIPVRFLEVILGQLKQGGFVSSQRGNVGGYTLLREPKGLTVGEIIEFVQGPVGPVACVTGESRKGAGSCPLLGECVFMPMWKRVQEAMSEVYDSTTFGELVEEYRKKSGKFVPSYSI